MTNTAVTVPIQGYSATTGLPSNAASATFFFYTVDVQAYVFPGSAGIPTANNNTIVDTGTTLNFVPTPVAVAYNARFVPPAVFHPEFGLFLVDCHARVPAFSVRIGGKNFVVDGRDQIIPAGEDEDGNIICITGTQDGGPDVPGNIFILCVSFSFSFQVGYPADGMVCRGDTFLHNVVTTYNPVAGQITISERVPY